MKYIKTGYIKVFILTLIFLIGLYLYNWIKLANALSLLEKGQITSIGNGHKRVTFVQLDRSVITVDNLPFLPLRNLDQRIDKCGAVYSQTRYWIE